jgi:predicted acyl esterase
MANDTTPPDAMQMMVHVREEEGAGRANTPRVTGVRRALLAAVALAVALAPPARAEGYELSEAYIESTDGVRLHAFVYRPAGAGAPVPVVLTVTPYAGTGSNFVSFGTDPLGEVPLVGSPAPGPGRLAERLLDLGYGVVVVSLRGYGGSGGCLDFGGAGEQADVRAAIRWSASQPWSDGDVAMIGHSYPGQTGLMGLASREPALRAVVAGAPPAGYHNLYTNGVANLPSAHFYPGVYALSDLYPPSVFSPVDQHANAAGGTAADPACPAMAATSFSADPSSPYWVERDLVPRIEGSTVPTLLTQGFNDYQVRPNGITDIWRALDGPRRLVLGPYDHGIHPADGSWDDEVVAWFDRYLRGGEAGAEVPTVRIQSVDGSWRAEGDWPPPGVADRALPVLAGSYLDVAGNSGETGPPDLWPVAPPMRQGQGSWTFTPPLPSALHVAGEPRIGLDVRAAPGHVHVVVLVYDVDEEGDAQLVTRGAALARDVAAGVDLYPADWTFAAGHRVGVLVTGADDLWFEPSNTGTVVTVGGGSLQVPVLTDAGEPLGAGPFEVRPQHPPFRVDAELVASRTAG